MKKIVLIISFIIIVISCKNDEKSQITIKHNQSDIKVKETNNLNFKKIILNCEKNEFPKYCSSDDIKISIDYDNNEKFLKISNLDKSKFFQLEENFQGTGIKFNLFQSNIKEDLKFFAMDLEYEYSTFTYIYILFNKEIRFLQKIENSTQIENFKGLNYSISDKGDYSEMIINNGEVNNKVNLNHKVDSDSDSEKINLNENYTNLEVKSEQKSKVDLNNLKGEYYLNNNNDDTEFLLEINKNEAFFIESGNMGTLYNKYLLSTKKIDDKIYLYYVSTKEGIKSKLKKDGPFGVLYLENGNLYTEIEYLTKKYNLKNKIQVIKS